MLIEVTVVCQMCSKEGAQVIAVPTGVDKADKKYHFKICKKCSEEKTKYSPCWQVVGEYSPAVREI